jgi:GDP-L-fucose synthase
MATGQRKAPALMRKQIAETIAKVADWSGNIVYDTTKPDGMPRKVMDVSRLAALGWRSVTELSTGLKMAYDWYVANNTVSAG